MSGCQHQPLAIINAASPCRRRGTSGTECRPASRMGLLPKVSRSQPALWCFHGRWRLRAPPLRPRSPSPRIAGPVAGGPRHLSLGVPRLTACPDPLPHQPLRMMKTAAFPAALATGNERLGWCAGYSIEKGEGLSDVTFVPAEFLVGPDAAAAHTGGVVAATASIVARTGVIMRAAWLRARPCNRPPCRAHRRGRASAAGWRRSRSGNHLRSARPQAGRPESRRSARRDA